MIFGDTRIPERVWSKIDVRPGGCWLWTGSFSNAPHIRWKVNGTWKVVSARRVIFETEHGPQSAPAIGGCDSHCVNPAHAIAGTVLEVLAKYNAGHPWIVCPQGHVIAEVGYYQSGTHRRCRVCADAATLKQDRKTQRRRASRMPPKRRREYLERKRRGQEMWANGTHRRRDGSLGRTAQGAI